VFQGIPQGGFRGREIVCEKALSQVKIIREWVWGGGTVPPRPRLILRLSWGCG
jgi:hypothetical protein